MTNEKPSPGGSQRTIEILMATYNGRDYLSAQVDSILAQDDQHWHLTISDDGSSDDTRDLIDDYCRLYPDRICRLRSGRHFGNARDHFFYLMEHLLKEQCDTEWMLFSDQDDTWYPDKISCFRKAFADAELACDENTSVLVFSDQTPTDAELHPLAESLMAYQGQSTSNITYEGILFQNVVTGGAMGINRALAALGGKCTDTGGVIMHDWWLAAVAARFGKVIYIDRPLGTYRQHGTNSVGAKDVNSLRHIIRKLTNTTQVSDTIQAKKKMSGVFLDTYSASLTQADRAFLSQFMKPRSGLPFYLRERGHIHGIFRFLGMLFLG